MHGVVWGNSNNTDPIFLRDKFLTSVFGSLVPQSNGDSNASNYISMPCPDTTIESGEDVCVSVGHPNERLLWIEIDYVTPS